VARFGAVLDACVLVPHVLMDTLLSVADEDLYQPMWSEVILDETLRTLRAIYPDRNPHSFEARVASMERAFPHACVFGWKALEPGLASYWPDPQDAHVVAAAIRGRAEIIVTSNLKHFPEPLLDDLSLHAASPDTFLTDLLDFNKRAVLAAVRKQAEKTNNPGLGVPDIAKRLSTVAPEFAAQLLTRFR
jgi:predicted nucleic acid-binding protein